MIVLQLGAPTSERSRTLFLFDTKCGIDNDRIHYTCGQLNSIQWGRPMPSYLIHLFYFARCLKTAVMQDP